MPAFSAPILPADGGPADEFLSTVVDLCPLSVLFCRPVYDAASATIVDFTFDYFNPAAQQMLGLPQHPPESLLTYFPTAGPTGAFALYREAFLAGDTQRFQLPFQHDGLNGYYDVTTRRHGPLLLVYSSNLKDLPAQEQVLRQSQIQQQQAQRAAEREQARVKAIFAQVPLGLALYESPAHTVALANDNIGAMWGRPLSEVLGKPLLEAVPELQGQEFATLLTQVRRTGQPYAGKEVPATVHRAGQGLVTRYFDFTFQVLRGDDEQVLGLLNSAQDVTERVLARRRIEQLNRELTAAQQEAERRRGELERVLEQAPVAIAVYRGPAYTIELANATVARLWGRTREQLIGKGLFEALPEVAGLGYEELLDGVLATGVPFVAHAMAAQHERNGRRETAYWDFVYEPVHADDGRINGVMVVANEVTAQVLARRQVEQLNAELEARVQERTRQLEAAQAVAERERAQLRALLAQAPVAIALFEGEELRFTATNDAMAAFFGSTPAQVLGQPLLAALPELRGQGFDELLRQVRHTRVPVAPSETPVHLQREGRPATSYYNSVYQPFYGTEDQVLGVLAVAVEVTEQVLARQQVQTLNRELAVLNEELMVANQQLTRTNVELDTFVYVASHDLKAPITNIEGLAQALRETLPLPVQQEAMIAQLLDLLDSTISRFQFTITQLTDLSKLQLAHAGPAELVPLAAVVENVRLDLAPAIAAAGAELTVAVALDLEVSFSPANVRSIFYNLLSNAIKYRAPDRPCQVRVRAERTGPQVRVRIQDNGLGLNAHQQERLFGLFQRLHTHVEGTGVGLYITKRLVENGGGTIAVESKLGEGTTFTLTLPT